MNEIDLDKLKIDIYADGADLKSIERHCQNPLIKGFTTNPTLMRKAGIEDYLEFTNEALSLVGDKPISFEVFADNLDEMYKQATHLGSYGKNVFVKIPITNTKGVSTKEVVRQLAKEEGVKVNVTAVFTYIQVEEMVDAIGDNDSIISVFAGRIQDTGRDPVPYMKRFVRTVRWGSHKIKLLWASPRHSTDILKADECGCDIITVTDDLLKKMSLWNKPLKDFSLETVKMFYNDATASGYKL